MHHDLQSIVGASGLLRLNLSVARPTVHNDTARFTPNLHRNLHSPFRRHAQFMHTLVPQDGELLYTHNHVVVKNSTRGLENSYSAKRDY